MSNIEGAWYGVDLDRTLAHYDFWYGPEHIGKPIPAMVAKVKQMLAEGKDVRIFTARVDGGSSKLAARTNTTDVMKDIDYVKSHIERWCLEHIGCVLPITNAKDGDMMEIHDDIAIQIIPNTGIAVKDLLDGEHVLVRAQDLLDIRDAVTNSNINKVRSVLLKMISDKKTINPWDEWEIAALREKKHNT